MVMTDKSSWFLDIRYCKVLLGDGVLCPTNTNAHPPTHHSRLTCFPRISPLLLCHGDDGGLAFESWRHGRFVPTMLLPLLQHFRHFGIRSFVLLSILPG